MWSWGEGDTQFSTIPWRWWRGKLKLSAWILETIIFFLLYLVLSWLFHLPVNPPYPKGTRAGTWCFLEGEILLSVIGSVQPSREVLAGHSEVLHSQKHTCPLQIFAKASLNKALIHLSWKFPFSFHCLLIPYCNCLKTMIKCLMTFWACPSQTLWIILVFTMVHVIIESDCFHISRLCYSQ